MRWNGIDEKKNNKNKQQTSQSRCTIPDKGQSLTFRELNERPFPFSFLLSSFVFVYLRVFLLSYFCLGKIIFMESSFRGFGFLFCGGVFFFC